VIVRSVLRYMKWDLSFIMYKLVFTVESINCVAKSNEKLYELFDLIVKKSLVYGVKTFCVCMLDKAKFITL